MRLRTEARDGVAWSVEVARSRQSGAWARAVLPWSALYPELGLEDSGRMLDVAPVEPDPLEDFHRDKTSALHTGMGILGQRPGRGAPMPSFRERVYTAR